MTVLSAISAAQPQRIDAGRGRQHTVQHGDTLSGIAKQYGVSLSALKAANPQVLNPNVIYSGDRIAVPGGQAQSSSGGAPVQAGKSAAGSTAAKAGSTQLTMADYQRAASTLGVDVATVRAVADVESSGGGFLADGRPKILFERHIFARETGGRFNGSHPGISGSPGGYGASGANQHARFEQAFKLDPAAAMKSASWGEFQIMGFNHKMVGYDSVGKFVDAMRSSAGSQLDAFVSFIESAGLKGKLQNRDWAGFARGYNGPGYAKNNYDGKMAAAYAKYAGSNPPPVASGGANTKPAATSAPSASASATSAAASSAAQSSAGTYSVRSGDTLSGIAQQHGVSLSALAAANPQIRNIDLIFPNQVVKIPGGGSTGNAPRVGGDSRIDAPAPVGGSSSDAAKIAEKYLGWWAGDLKVSGHLPMDPSVPNTVNCANFVSAVLQKAGLINFHTNLVTGSNSGNPQALGTKLKAAGWSVVPASQARPGDVAIVNNGGHVELVHSNNNGKITLIGSNNTGGGSGPQKVSYGNPFGNAWYLTPPRK
ncbi:N-acetylmuramidase domain-containing protein [Lysobacter sp. A03]|uniref:N-acetylmuramidase domain-containing protein n=1 Tax=Lysobacter sp. A03 TaxID=1199154 RepID=UPI0005B71655|nr:N-acetylmuramidase domain-containing protein [Lysobacter sp. A03]KIQ97404.1 putative phage-encoded peptidoglycan binding protein [Lysobacter sp. A03]